MTDAAPNASSATKRRNEAVQVLKDFPGRISSEIHEKILVQQVVLGMAPYEAYLAAGSFTFKVSAEPTTWGAHADPYKVMWAQSVAPDDSEIWMTFETDTQFPAEGRKTFRVFFKAGKAVEIEKLSTK